MNDEIITLDEVMAFGRIEDYGDEEIIKLCLSSAIDMLKQSGVEPSGKPLYKMAVCRMTLHYYDNREELSNLKEVPFGIGTMIEQLRNEEVI